MPQGIITIMILSYHSNNQHGILQVTYTVFHLSLYSLLGDNLQVLLTIALSVITTEYIQLQAALSPKNHNRHLVPILINIPISTRNYFHF